MLKWRGRSNRVLLCILWISLFIIPSIHHIYITNRCPGSSWYGKLDILWFMKSRLFIFRFYSWPLKLQCRHCKDRLSIIRFMNTNTALILCHWWWLSLLVASLVLSLCEFEQYKLNPTVMLTDSTAFMPLKRVQTSYDGSHPSSYKLSPLSWANRCIK